MCIRDRRNGESATTLGAEIRNNFDGIESYLNGKLTVGESWEATAGISSGTEEDDASWFLEGFSNNDFQGNQDHGARVGLRLRW